MKHPRSSLVALSATLILAASCATSSAPAAPPAPAERPALSEAEIVAAGALLFSEGRISDAARAWSAIADPSARSRYVSFVNAYSAFDAYVAGAERTLAESGPEAAVTAVAASWPLPDPPAGSLEGSDADPRGAAARLALVGSEAAHALAAKAAEAERADDDARRADAKAGAAEENRRRLIKDSLLSFPDRMGEVFARSPSEPTRLSDRQLLDFNAETAAIISGGISDFDRIVAENPDILDPATIERLRDSANGLSVRFARIEATIMAVKDRGRPLMPLIIGTFNPQPGDPMRSRPAAFSGVLAAGSDWWWGIADIPKGLAQDLVVTMSDSRPVRVYAAGSGARRPASDLVNPIFKVGNSWPVLNAGARLDDGVFHIEVGPSRGESYSGEAVVYKSFMTRTR